MAKKKISIVQTLKSFVLVLAAALLLPALYIGFVTASTPAPIRKPGLEHLHFRMQILVDNQPIDFSQAEFQKDYSKDQCTADLSKEPFHFHDDKDQFVHVHWKKMTGGLLMKYYGWNFVGGSDNKLGYRLDDLGEVSIHGKLLPEFSEDSKFYIYTGDERGYTVRDLNDWRVQDFEEFFDKTSNINSDDQTSLINKLLPKAYAHDGEDQGATTAKGTEEEEKLQRINNLLGNIVIFVQKDQPTDQQIKDRFGQLSPLSDSTCGG